jgi:NCS1 family nucleobase:cation symporter-1
MSEKNLQSQEIDLTKDYDSLEPVPMEARTYNKLNMFLMWFGANAKPGNWFIGGVFGVAGLMGALFITVLGSAVAYLFNIGIGLIGFTAGIATFAITRTVFGIRGSKIFSILNATSFVGWCFINGIVAAKAMNAVSIATIGYDNLFVWGAVMGVLQGVSVIWGREAIRRIGTVGSAILVVASVAICIVLMIKLPKESLLQPMSDETRSQMGALFSMCIGVNLGWAPAAADFGRYAKDKGTATWISYVSLLITAALFFMTGTMGYIATGEYDPAGQFLAMGLAWPFLILIIILTVTTNVVNIYTGAMSLENAFAGKLSPRKAILILAIIQVRTSYGILSIARSCADIFQLSVYNIRTAIYYPYCRSLPCKKA